LKRRFPSPTIADGMMTLAVDTSGPIGGVGLLDDGAIADERTMEQPMRHAERLLSLVEEVLEANGRTKEQIERVCVNVGPGSFTGLRIGVATAKGICQALEVELVGIDGTLVYRAQAVDEPRVCVVIPSRRDLFYVRWFTGRRPKATTSVMHEAELVRALQAGERDAVLVGSGAERVFERAGRGAKLRIGPEGTRRLSALKLAQLGASESGGRLYEVEPLYVESGL
jgi:tRNA threonylcarbamoyladenosine biosynthesis protein TsaB